jgi:hypothetical protein
LGPSAPFWKPFIGSPGLRGGSAPAVRRRVRTKGPSSNALC